MASSYTTGVPSTTPYTVTVVGTDSLTMSLSGPTGPTGPTGATGATGAAGTINTSTSTTLNGYIYGNGTTVAGATAATSANTANTLVKRDANGIASFKSVNFYDTAEDQDLSLYVNGFQFQVQNVGYFNASRQIALGGDYIWTFPNENGNVAITNTSSIQSWSGTQTFTGAMAITNATASTTTGTGALVVSGGVGIGGAVNVGGASSFTSTTRPTAPNVTGTPATNSLITQTDGVDLAINPNNIIVRDDFMGGGITSQTIGDLGWYTSSSGGGTGAAVTSPASILPNIGVKNFTCGNATNAGTVVYLTSLSNLLTYAGWELCFVTKLTQITDCDLIVGFTKDNIAIGIGKFGGISFGARYSSATDTNFMFYSKNTNSTFAANDASNYAISSGVAAGTTFNTFRIRSIVAGALQMSINGGSFVAVDTSLIPTSGVFIPFFYIATRTTTSKSIDVDFFSMKMQSIAR